MLHTPYTPYDHSKKDYFNLKYVSITSIPASLNSYKAQRLGTNKFNEVSKLLRERSKGVFKYESSISETDALLYYISCLTAKDGNSRFWFPHTCDGSFFEVTIIKKLKSLTHFNKIKTILKVANKEELAAKIKFVQENKIESRLNRYYYELAYIYDVFDFDVIGVNP